MDTTTLTQTSATALARLIGRRDVSAEETVRAYLNRIEEINPTLNTVIQIAPESAIEQARAADQALARGESTGPLHGIPVTVKDVFPIVESARMIAAPGMPEPLYFGESRESTVVTRLRMAGAIPIAVTKATQWSDREEHYGLSHNPYDLTRTTGGSSGGTAATIAAGGAAIGIGSDSGGSLRLPAHYCGIATLRPSNGRVPRGIDSDSLIDPRTVSGPLARSVEDLIVTMEVIAGIDTQDTTSLPLPWRNPRQVNLRGLRCAVFTNNGLVAPTPDVNEAVTNAAESLERAGAITDFVVPPAMNEAWQITRKYLHYCGAEGRVGEYFKFLESWDRYRLTMAEFMSDYDLIICPVEADAAPVAGDKSGADSFTYTAPFSLVGWPCAVVRAGTSANGLPIGVQVVGAPWRDDLALAAALHLENTVGGWQPSPLNLKGMHPELAAR